MTSVPPLPREITDKIIDEVAELRSFESLKACALVSRSWLPRSQHHALSRILFIGNRKFDEWHSHILNHQRPGGPSHHITWIDYNTSRREPFCKESDECLRYLTNVRKLRMFGAHFRRMPNFGALGSTLRVLMLVNCWWDMDSFLTFLGCFPRLEDLSIMEIHILAAGQDTVVSEAVSNPKGEHSPTAAVEKAPPPPLCEVSLKSFYDHDDSEFEYEDNAGSEFKRFLESSQGTLTGIEIHGESSVHHIGYMIVRHLTVINFR